MQRQTMPGIAHIIIIIIIISVIGKVQGLSRYGMEQFRV